MSINDLKNQTLPIELKTNDILYRAVVKTDLNEELKWFYNNHLQHFLNN